MSSSPPHQIQAALGFSVMKVVGIFASKVTRKYRSSPARASAAPQIHLGCGAAVGSGGADIWSQKFGWPFAAVVVVIVADRFAAAGFRDVAGAGLVVARGAGAHVADATQKRNNDNTAAIGLLKSFLGIR